jgi:hypothetical protein
VSERLLRGKWEEVAPGLSAFMRIHSERWKGLGFPSAFDDPLERGFFEEMTRRFAGRDWLRIFLLEVDGVDVAASLEFLYRGRAYMYHCNATGPEDVMRSSPGLLVKFFAIRSDIAEGMCEYDMLRGEESYKYEHLKAVERFNSTIRMAAPPRLSRFRFRVFLVWLLAKKSIGRTKLEYYQWRRFTITKNPRCRGKNCVRDGENGGGIPDGLAFHQGLLRRGAAGARWGRCSALRPSRRRVNSPRLRVPGTSSLPPLPGVPLP